MKEQCIRGHHLFFQCFFILLKIPDDGFCALPLLRVQVCASPVADDSHRFDLRPHHHIGTDHRRHNIRQTKILDRIFRDLIHLRHCIDTGGICGQLEEKLLIRT